MSLFSCVFSHSATRCRWPLPCVTPLLACCTTYHVCAERPYTLNHFLATKRCYRRYLCASIPNLFHTHRPAMSGALDLAVGPATLLAWLCKLTKLVAAQTLEATSASPFSFVRQSFTELGKFRDFRECRSTTSLGFVCHLDCF